MKRRRAGFLVIPVAAIALAAVLVVSGALPLGSRSAIGSSDPVTATAGAADEAAAGSAEASGSNAAEPVEPAGGVSSTAASATGTPGAAGDAATGTANAASEVVAEEAPAERRILVSIAKRRLWLVEGRDTLLRAPVAIGMGKDFSWQDKNYHFATPKGERRVIAKAKDPIWTVPEWHYYEKATKLGYTEVVKLQKDARVQLADSSFLVVRGDTVGRINHFGNFAPFTPGTEIIYDGVVYIPPPTSLQRRVPDALGPFKLDMGDGYLIHGTHPYNEDSIGEAVSHGCVRMNNEDLIQLYPMVPRGTKVTIF
jgi:lipoprotein-anchoring transpeptidase ErfK/SrfK